VDAKIVGVDRSSAELMIRALVIAQATLLIAAADPIPTSTVSPSLSVQVRAARPPARRGAGDLSIDPAILEAAPHALAGELLSSVPGMFVDHEDGEGVANDVIVRGFDFDHGGGIELRVGPYPINVPAHIHGQGYADLNFIIPEVVRGLHVLEGSYDPRQGDFALGGSATFELGVDQRGASLKGSYGSFTQGRVLGIWAPEEERPGTFAAATARHTSGFGPGNRASDSAGAIAQWDLGLSQEWRLIATAIAYAADAKLPGVVRLNDVAAGRIGLFDSYPPPFGSGQSALARRVLGGVDLVRAEDDGTRTELALFGTFTGFRLRENFTGATLGMMQGDLDETVDDQLAFGGRALHRFARRELAPGVLASIEPGLSLRAGRTVQSQSFLAAADLSGWDRVLDASLVTLDAGAYLDVDALIAGLLHVSGGLRGDLFSYSAHDRLRSADPSAINTVLAPRVSVSCEATRWLEPTLSYGVGYRSPSSRSLLMTHDASVARSRSIEVGFRARDTSRDLTMSGAAFITRLSDELVFEPESASLQSEGATTRRGATLAIAWRPPAWILASAALTYVSATFDHPAVGEPKLVPQIPALLAHADATVWHELGVIEGEPLVGRIGVGYTHLSSRPIDIGAASAPVDVVNASASLRVDAIELGLEAYNVLDLRYPDQELIYASNWSGPTSQARHQIAAAPRTVLVSLTIRP
jgi:hypothetical protein